MEGKIIRNELVKQLRVHDFEIIIDDGKDWVEKKVEQVLNFKIILEESSRYNCWCVWENF